jgi:hypothetical protein
MISIFIIVCSFIYFFILLFVENEKFIYEKLQKIKMRKNIRLSLYILKFQDYQVGGRRQEDWRHIQLLELDLLIMDF